MLLGPINHLNHITDRFVIGWDMIGDSSLVGTCHVTRPLFLSSIPSVVLVGQLT